LISINFLLDATGWTWIVMIAALVIGGYFFLDRLMRKGIYEGRAGGGILGRMGISTSELQMLVDPAHRHVIQEQDRKRSEHDDAGDDPDQIS
jgi:hypothetical protein